MRVMGLDFGSKTVGVAVSDPLFVTAQGIETIRRKSENKLRQTLSRIKELCDEYEVERIVLGYPVHMDGTSGIRCEKTRKFAELLEKRTSLEIIFRDERLTTVQADEILSDMGVPESDKKQYIDMIAAVVILQDYMNDPEVRENGTAFGKKNVFS